MIGLLILAQQEIGKGLILATEHVLGCRPARLDNVEVDYTHSPEQLAQVLQQHIQKLNEEQGILILADVYGATHTNVACRFLKKNHIELVAGVNLPMLIRVLNYRDLGLPDLVLKALTGGTEGITCATALNQPTEAHR